MTCKIDGCEKPAKGGKGYCKGHYHKLVRYGNPLQGVYNMEKRRCPIDGCGRWVEYFGYCSLHGRRLKRNGSPIALIKEPQIGRICEAVECDEPAFCKGYCQTHYKTHFKYGRDFMIIGQRGAGTITKDGYREIYVNGEKIFEHIYIVEQILGRKLPPGAVVHHVDEDRLNNTPTNLVVCPNQAYHMLLHTRMRKLGIKFEQTRKIELEAESPFSMDDLKLAL
jgi:hypothetical protein